MNRRESAAKNPTCPNHEMPLPEMKPTQAGATKNEPNPQTRKPNLTYGYLNPGVSQSLNGLGSAVAGKLGELLQGTPGNTGDVNLAADAMNLGARLSGKTINGASSVRLNDISGIFTRTFCR